MQKNQLKRLAIVFSILAFLLISYSIFSKVDFKIFASGFKAKNNIISSKNYMVVDLKTGERIIEKGVNEKVRPASLAKLYSIYLTSNMFDSNTVLNLDNDVSNMIKKDSSLAGLKRGAYYAKNVYHAILAPSGNDATYMLAAHVGGSLDRSKIDPREKVEAYGKHLNYYLKENGFKDTEIHDITGYCDKTFTSINDLDKVVQYLLNINWFKDISSKSWAKTIGPDGQTYTWLNTNKFLDENSDYFNPKIKGVKTGTLSGCYNLISLYQTNKTSYLIYVIGASSDEMRYQDTLSLIEKINK